MKKKIIILTGIIVISSAVIGVIRGLKKEFSDNLSEFFNNNKHEMKGFGN